MPFSVLSAKHGLLEPDTPVEPYDFSLASLNREERRLWAERVLSQALSAHPTAHRFVLLADDDYRDDLVPLLLQKHLDVVEPLLGFERSARMSFLRHAHRLLLRETSIAALYKCFEALGNHATLPTLREALVGKLPDQGVYFFFDPNEQSRFSVRVPRLVRIGTHAVSNGSKATLRDRLRAHFGTSEGYGNHRASVFRLHVGEALIRRNDLRKRYPHWGIGQNVERAVVNAERDLEKAVSDYISRLQLCNVRVSDKASKHSARSTIERLTIALFTEALVPLEPPSPNWLGLHSTQPAIVKTGLWNVRDAGSKANFDIVNLLSQQIRAA